MDYDFGDILDARKASKPLGHFLVILGETKKNEVMYYIVTSRVYTVFKDLLSFFNDCIIREDKNFFKYFGKEKDKSSGIISHGNLIDALFLDKHSCYGLCFDIDSMIVLNSEPLLIDKEALETLRTDQKVFHKDKLSDVDLYKLISMVKHSPHISPDKVYQTSASFNQVIREKRTRQLRTGS